MIKIRDDPELDNVLLPLTKYIEWDGVLISKLVTVNYVSSSKVGYAALYCQTIHSIHQTPEKATKVFVASNPNFRILLPYSTKATDLAKNVIVFLVSTMTVRMIK